MMKYYFNKFVLNFFYISSDVALLCNQWCFMVFEMYKCIL